MICYIVRSSTCPLGFASGFVGLGIAMYPSLLVCLSVGAGEQNRNFGAIIVTCDIFRSSICPFGLLSGFVGLGISNISFSARLSVRWGKRVESYFRGDNCKLLHCPLVRLSFGLGEWIRRFGDYQLEIFPFLCVCLSLGASEYKRIFGARIAIC